jgi:hypothetical protein
MKHEQHISPKLAILHDYAEGIDVVPFWYWGPTQVWIKEGD